MERGDRGGWLRSPRGLGHESPRMRCRKWIGFQLVRYWCGLLLDGWQLSLWRHLGSRRNSGGRRKGCCLGCRFRFGRRGRGRFPSLIYTRANLRLRMSMNQRLRLQLNLILNLLRRWLFVRFAGSGSDDGRLRAGVNDCLCLDLGQGRNLGGIHRNKTSTPILCRGHDSLCLRSRLYHCLCLCLYHFWSYICLLPSRRRSLKLRL